MGVVENVFVKHIIIAYICYVLFVRTIFDCVYVSAANHVIYSRHLKIILLKHTEIYVDFNVRLSLAKRSVIFVHFYKSN